MIGTRPGAPVMALAVLALVVVVAACSGDAAPATSVASYVGEWQQTVDDLGALQRYQHLPERLIGQGAALDGSEFEVGEYFGILGHIDTEPGFDLDYVYRVTPDRAYPVLYVHRTDQPGYGTYEEYLIGTGSGAVPQGDTGYLDQIYVVDGTPAGFFEYTVLRVMGGQFYLFFHAAEDDAVVVATREALEEALAPVAAAMGETGLAAARAADPTPIVTLEADTATVEVLVFTRWSGLQRRTYVYDRVFPQVMVGVTVETIAPCDCGIPF